VNNREKYHIYNQKISRLLKMAIDAILDKKAIVCCQS